MVPTRWLTAITAPVTFEKYIVLPASHPQKDAANNGEVVPIGRVDGDLSPRAAWKIVRGDVIIDFDGRNRSPSG